MSSTISTRRHSGGGLFISFFAVMSLLVTGSAMAQLEEIVVTATKREGSLQDAPLAVSAFTGDDLARQGVNSSMGLNNVVPNLTMNTEAARGAVFINIRGISQSERRNTGDPVTAFYVDGIYVPRMSGVSAYFYDVERVEVLRGPQGTLYGRNSTAGVVNVITNKPNFDGVGGDVEVTLGNYQWAQFKGALNIPLTDNVSSRFAFIRNTRDGYRNNVLVENGDDADDVGIRGQLLWNIGDDSSLLFSADTYTRKGVGGVSAQVACPPPCNWPVAPDPADTNPLSTQGSLDNKDTNFKLEFNHSFSGVDLAVLGGWREHGRDALLDNDYSGIPVNLGGPFGVKSPDGFLFDKIDSEAFVGEVRLSSNGDGPINWIAGAFLLDEELDAYFAVQPMRPTGQNTNVEFPDKGFTSTSKAAYANISWDMSDAFTLNGGIRYTEDEKDKGGVSDPTRVLEGSYQRLSTLQTGQLVGPPTPRSQVSNPSWDKTNWMLGVDWRTSAESLAYAKISTGYKAGGFNRGSDDPNQPSGSPFVKNLVVYNPEELTAYEAGYKTTIMDNRMRLNVAAFYYDYKDNQQAVVSSINGILVNSTINAATATIKGFEIESTYAYNDNGGQLDFNLGYLDAKFDEFIGTDDPMTRGPDNLDLSGGDMINAPDWNFTVTWIPGVWDMWGGTVSPMLAIHYESAYITRVHNQAADQQPSYTRSNASLLWESDGESGMYAEVFVNNIEDKDVVTWSACGEVINGAVGGAFPGLGCNHMYAAPRTYGARMGYRF